MAHALEIRDGKADFVYAGEVPWHGLGTQIPDNLAPEEVLRKANLDWEVESTPLYANINGSYIETKQKALIRSSDDKILTYISDDWKPVQNREAFAFFDEYVKTGHMRMETAGSLKEGQMVFALAKINDGFKVFGEDRIEGYLLFSNPHQYGKSIDVRFTPIRVVCNNTLTMAINSKAQYAAKVNHRSIFNPDAVKEVLGISHEKLLKYKEQAEFLGKKRYTKETLTEYFKTIFPAAASKEISTPAEQALEIIHAQPGAEFAEGSFWQAFNCITYMADWTLGRGVDTRIHSAWYGKNRQRKEQALELALEMAKVA
jgi:phage/plasmid-like protein (TIGR03299 family)